MEKTNKISFCNLYSTVTSGMEKLSKLEFQEKLEPKIKSLEIFPGKIIFLIHEQESFLPILKQLLERMKSIEHLFLVLFSFDFEEKILKIIKESPTSEKMKLTNSFLKEKFSENLISNKEIIQGSINIYKELKLIDPHPFKFRIDVKENVTPRSEKNNLAKYLAELLQEKIPSIEPEITEYALKFNIEKINQRFYFSIKLTMNKPLGISQISISREKTPATMRPSIAYNLCRLLNIHDGDIIIDPMCGSSTIVEIALKEFKNQAYYICSDIDEISLQKSQKNLGILGYVDLVLCNAMRSPFRPNAFDKIITDMPFGKRCGSHNSNLKDYPKLIKEFQRFLKNEGQIITVTTEKSLIFSNFKKKNGWRREEFFLINKGGLDAYVTSSKKKLLIRKKKEKIKENEEEKKVE